MDESAGAKCHEGRVGGNFLEALQSLVHKPIDEYLLSLCAKECKIMFFFIINKNIIITK